MGMSPSLALGAQSAGAALSMVGAWRGAKAQQASLNYEAGIQQNNQTIANMQADAAEQIGAQQEQAQQLKTAALKGDQRAALAANGVDLGVGSAAEQLATTDFMGKRDALTIRDNAARQAWALREQGKGYGAEAAASRAAAGAISPLMAAGGSLLSNAGSVASSWYKYRKATQGNA